MTVIEQCKKTRFQYNIRHALCQVNGDFVLNVVVVLMLDAVLLLAARAKHVVNVQSRRVILSVVYFSEKSRVIAPPLKPLLFQRCQI